MLTTAGALLTFSSPAIAQESNADALLENPQAGDSNSSDPFSTNGSGQMNSVYDLIHRATLGSFLSPDEFLQDQQESIQTEASDFRTRQREMLQQHNQPESTTTQPTNQSN